VPPNQPQTPQARDIVLVAAVADNGVIGARGRLPWHLPADLRRFKAMTMGRPVIMGRRTFDSIGRALPRRRNIVITRDRGWKASGAEVAASMDEALALARDDGAVMVIGGAEVYALALPRADRIELTEVHATPEGDTYFPPIAPEEWRERRREEFPSDAGRPAYAFVTLERRRDAKRGDAA